jgi:hypothetical protein
MNLHGFMKNGLHFALYFFLLSVILPALKGYIITN